MITALRLCSLALNPTAPSPTAQMVKVDDGMMSAYGGVFCVRVPVKQDIGAAFNPKALGNFFRKERAKVAYTIKFPKLTVSEGKERLTINCLSPDELPIIDNIEIPLKCSLNKANLKMAVEVLESNVHEFARGVTFRDGAVLSTNNKVFFIGASELPDDLEFGIPKEAAIALTKFKSDVVSLSKNNHTVKFIFSDGSSLCSHMLEEKFPSFDALFEGDWQEFSITEDITSLECDHVVLRDGSVFYHSPDTIGELVGAVEGSVEVSCMKKFFDCLYRVNSEMEYVPGQRIKAVGEDCMVITSVLRV